MPMKNHVIIENQKTMEHSKLNALLSSFEIAAINAKGRHWLVSGHSFDSIHKLLDDVWGTCLEGADVVAETIRVLSGVPETDPSGWEELSQVTIDITTKNATAANALTFVTKTRDELNVLIAAVHELVESNDVDPTLESDLTGVTSKLRHHILFLDGFISNWTYAK